MLANRLLTNSILIIMRTEVLVSVPYAIRALSHSTTTWMLLCRAMNMRSSYPLPKLSDIMVLNRSFSYGATVYVVPKTVVDTVLPKPLWILCCQNRCGYCVASGVGSLPNV